MGRVLVVVVAVGTCIVRRSGVVCVCVCVLGVRIRVRVANIYYVTVGSGGVCLLLLLLRHLLYDGYIQTTTKHMVNE